MLYTGYVGFSVAFAFACAAMLEGKMDQVWARWTRPWTTAAWGFLSMGIALGSWWAYYELGWGGYWFWDAVENASFMPWLAGTALIHSLAVTDKRGLFKSWTLLLAILAFSLSLLGTFLVRSGSITSVHAFAADPGRGMFILAFFVIIVGGALALYAWRAPLLKSQAGFSVLSREAFLLFNNILLIIATAIVFGGTLAPLIAEATGYTLSVGTPYFNAMFPIPMIPLLALVPIGIQAAWKKGSLSEKKKRPADVAGHFGRCSSIAVIVGILRPRARAHAGGLRRRVLDRHLLARRSDRSHPPRALALAQCHRHDRGAPRARDLRPRHHVGGVVHAGARHRRRPRRDRHARQLRASASTSSRTSKARTTTAYAATSPSRTKASRSSNLEPEKRLYWVQRQGMTEAGIGSYWGSNIFLALGDDLGAGKWSVRLQIRPLVNYVWIAAFLMALGGGIAASDRRYRTAKAAADEVGRGRAPRCRVKQDDESISTAARRLRAARGGALRRREELSGSRAPAFRAHREAGARSSRCRIS